MEEHEYFEELIFREDSLSDSERDELNAHLSRCADCSLFRDDWIAVNRLLTDEPAVSPEAGFVVLFENEKTVPAPVRKMIPWKELSLFAVLLLLMVTTNISLIRNHIWLGIIVRAAERIMMLRIIWDSFTAFLYMIRLPLLICGTGAIIAAFIVGFGILLGLRQFDRSHEERGI